MKHQLKRIPALALAVAMGLGLAACGASSSSSPQSGSGSSSGSEAPSFDYSAMLEENGYWKGIKARKLVTLPEGYMGLEFPEEVRTVTDEQVDDMIHSILLSAATDYEKITDRAVEDGDMVNIDYVGSVDGVEFSGGNTNGAGTDVLAGSKDYVDDFLTQIIGHMPGETIDVVVTFPDDYRDSTDPDGNPMLLKNKEAVFKTTINHIMGEPILPELTDEFVASRFGKDVNPELGLETVDALRKNIHDDLLQGQKMDHLNKWIVDNSTVSEVPEEMLEHMKNTVLADMEQQAAAYGMTTEMLLQMQGTTEEDYLNSITETLRDNAAYYLSLQAIAEKEGLEMDEKAARKELGENYDNIVAQYGTGYTHQVLLARAVLDYLIEHAA